MGDEPERQTDKRGRRQTERKKRMKNLRSHKKI
jgi:hypothetical protein